MRLIDGKVRPPERMAQYGKTESAATTFDDSLTSRGPSIFNLAQFSRIESG